MRKNQGAVAFRGIGFQPMSEDHWQDANATGFATLGRSPLLEVPGTAYAVNHGMPVGMHNYSKEQREAVRQLVHTVLMRDMATFSPDRFKDWIKDMDARFRKVALTLVFDINNRSVHFTIKELRTGRSAFRFTSATRVRFDDKEVIMSAEDLVGASKKF
jgi:hypothetical protein